MTAFLTFLNPRRLLIAAALAGAVFLGWKVYDGIQSHIDMLQVVVEQRQQIFELEAEVKTNEMEMERAREAQRVAEMARRFAEEQAEKYRDLSSQIDQSPEENDGPIAPVLRDTLDALGRLR